MTVRVHSGPDGQVTNTVFLKTRACQRCQQISSHVDRTVNQKKRSAGETGNRVLNSRSFKGLARSRGVNTVRAITQWTMEGFRATVVQLTVALWEANNLRGGRLGVDTVEVIWASFPQGRQLSVYDDDDNDGGGDDDDDDMNSGNITIKTNATQERTQN